MKNLLSENMLRFGTKNLSEAAQKELTLKSILETIDQYGLQNEVRKALAEQADPNLGLAQKIVGTLMAAMGGMGTDNQKVLQAVLMIKDKAIYDSVLKLVKTSPKIKTKYGRNFPTVGKFISTDMAIYGPDDIGAADSATNAIAKRINNHLQRVSGNMAEGIDMGGWDIGIGSVLRGE